MTKEVEKLEGTFTIIDDDAPNCPSSFTDLISGLCKGPNKRPDPVETEKKKATIIEALTETVKEKTDFDAMVEFTDSKSISEVGFNPKMKVVRIRLPNIILTMPDRIAATEILVPIVNNIIAETQKIKERKIKGDMTYDKIKELANEILNDIDGGALAKAKKSEREKIRERAAEIAKLCEGDE